ncbi:dihydroorotase [bacterium]|nr:dihydroorotase [bacterium]
MNKKFDYLLVKNAKILETDEILDFVVKNDTIDFVGKIDTSNFNGEVWDVQQKTVACGLTDIHVHFREPGQEHKETLHSGSETAKIGGFTSVCCMPNTKPAIDNEQIVSFIKQKSQNEITNIYPIGTISKERKGVELSLIAEMVEAGAVAISDDGSCTMNSELVRYALEYSKMYGIPVITHAEDHGLTRGAAMNEGLVATKLGLKGWPSVAEDIIVAREILLSEFTGGKMHIAHTSTKGSIELLRRAKEKGINITCEVTPHHFTLTDEAVTGYNTNAKMCPPLREQADVEALIEGLRDGTVDVIATDHAPHHVDDKDTDFPSAAMGITGLETAIGLIGKVLVANKILTWKQAIEKISKNPRKILNFEIPQIKKGSKAEFTVLDLEKIWTYNLNETRSKSKNSPFDAWELQGKAIGVVNKGMIFKS